MQKRTTRANMSLRLPLLKGSHALVIDLPTQRKIVIWGYSGRKNAVVETSWGRLYDSKLARNMPANQWFY